MPVDLLGDIIRQINERRRKLAAVVREYERLEAARAALDGTAGSRRPAGRRRATKTGRRGRVERASGDSAETRRRTRAVTRPRAPRGANREAFLNALRERPGSSVPEVAHRTGVQPAVLYQLRRRLLDDGTVVEQPRDDGRKGYALTGR
jgi:hypothetical protein